MDEVAKEALNRAVDAGIAGDVRKYLEELAVGPTLDGVVNGLRRRWPDADEAVVHDAVADASDALYTRLSEGVRVLNPGAFLWGAAKNQLLKWQKERQDARERQVPLTEECPAPRAIQDDPSGDDPSPERRREALRVARGLLPRLGQQNVQRVMGFIFDGIEADELYLDNATIADALGLSIETVRRVKNRGWERLEREARKAGIPLPEAVAAAYELTGSEEPEE